MPLVLDAPHNAPAPIRLSRIAGERVAPVDEYGMPYAIHPYETPPNKPDIIDEHHAFFQRSNPALQDEAGLALRQSRVHMVPRWLHDSTHKAFFDGLEKYPETEAEKFGLLILSCAGYLSKMAIDMRKRTEPKLVPMSRDTYNYVRGKQQLHPETRRAPGLTYRNDDLARQNIGRFMGAYARRQSLDHVKSSLIDEFLNSRNPKRVRKLGCSLLAQAVDVAVDPVNERYGVALQQGLVRPLLVSPRKVVKTYFNPITWPDHVGRFREEIALRAA